MFYSDEHNGCLVLCTIVLLFQ